MKIPDPSLFICGAPRAGTTSLYRFLRQHPDVCMTRRKETGIFLENYDRGITWLKSNYLTHYNGEAVVGEATTGHIQHPPSARRMAKMVPNARLVFILRNPVERVYSHYRFHRQSGRLIAADSFSELIRDRESDWRRIHLDHGLYYKHLNRYAHHFDRAQLKIFFFEDLRSDPLSTALELYRFAGVDPTFEPDISRAPNAGGLPKQEWVYRIVQRIWRPARQRLGLRVLDATQVFRDRVRDYLTHSSNRCTMREVDRLYLQEFYREPNRRLENWLDIDLSRWG